MLQSRLRNRGRRAAILFSSALALVGSALIGGGMLAQAQTQTPTLTTAEKACEAGTPTAAGASEACLGIGEFDIFYKPNVATVPADTDVKVVLKNSGVIAHNFSITDHGNTGLKNLNISVDIANGTTALADVNAPEGVYYFFCNVPGHEAAGMRGFLTVKKDATITTSEATVTPRAG